MGVLITNPFSANNPFSNTNNAVTTTAVTATSWSIGGDESGGSGVAATGAAATGVGGVGCVGSRRGSSSEGAFQSPARKALASPRPSAKSNTTTGTTISTTTTDKSPSASASASVTFAASGRRSSSRSPSRSPAASTSTPSMNKLSHILLADAVILTPVSGLTGSDNTAVGGGTSGRDGSVVVSTQSNKKPHKTSSKTTNTTLGTSAGTKTTPTAAGKNKPPAKGLTSIGSPCTRAASGTGGGRNDHGNGLFKTNNATAASAAAAAAFSPSKQRHLKRHLSPYAMQSPLFHTTATASSSSSSTTSSSSTASSSKGKGKSNASTGVARVHAGSVSSGTSAGGDGAYSAPLGGIGSEKRVRFSEKEEVYLINKEGSSSSSSSSQGQGLVE